jgi:cell division cycle 14
LGRSASKNGTSTPPNRGSARTPLGEMDQDHSRDKTIGVQEDYLPAPTPGQPRKMQRLGAERHHPYSRGGTAIHEAVEEEAAGQETATEVITMHRTSQGTESDEEWHLRMRTHRKASASLSPDHRRERSVSHQTTTTTTTVYQVIDNDSSNDIENIGTAAAKTKSLEQSQRATSASGVLTKVRGGNSAKRAAGSVREAGVRKTSGRIGSISGTATSAAATTVRKISGI